jgi:hypothetical protein
MADDADPLWRILDNPATRALLSIAAIVGGVVLAKNQFSTADGRREYWDQVRQGAAERRQRERILAIQQAKNRVKRDYLNGPGNVIYRQRALTVIGPERPFADARFERLQGGFRERAFRASSNSAGASIEVNWDMADRDGHLRLSLADGRTWSFGFRASQTDLGEDLGGRTQSARNDEIARIACRLLATSGSPFATITFLDSDHWRIEEEVWQEYVASRPEVGGAD